MLGVMSGNDPHSLDALNMETLILKRKKAELISLHLEIICSYSPPSSQRTLQQELRISLHCIQLHDPLGNCLTRARREKEHATRNGSYMVWGEDRSTLERCVTAPMN